MADLYTEYKYEYPNKLGDLVSKFDSYNSSTGIYTGLVKILGIKEYKITRNKLWKEAKRNMAGELNAVFLGVYPKLELKIRVTKDSEIQTLSNIFDTSYLKIKWWDYETKTFKNGTFYANDYGTELISKYGTIGGGTSITQNGVPIPNSDPPSTKTVVTTTYTSIPRYKEFSVNLIPIKRGGNDLSV